MYRKNILLLLSLSSIFFFKYLPAPNGLPIQGMQVLGIFLGSLLLWLTISIEWSSVLAIFAIAIMPTTNFKIITLNAFGNETFLFLLFTFICTYVLSQTLFLKRCAIAFISNSIAKKNGWNFITFFFLSVLTIGLFISPSVLFMIFFPLLEQIYSILKLKKESRAGNILMAGLVFSTSLAAGMTPISHVFSLLAMGLYEKATGITINHISYMMIGIPVGIVSFLLMIIIFRFVYRPDLSEIQHIDTTNLQKDLPPATREEKITVTLFLIMLLLWVLPGLLKEFFPIQASTISSLGSAMPPLLISILFAIITVNDKPLLNFSEALSKGVPWASLLMTAAALTIGSAMTNPEIGISTWIVNSFMSHLSPVSPFIVVAIFVTWAGVQTNLTSNLVTVTLVTTAAIPFFIANRNTHTATICVLIGMISSFAFASPSAMPYIALAGSSGWISAKKLFFYGVIQMTVTIAIVSTLGYFLASKIL
ncbi:MAG: SLC13 family permease [Treponemataceae bacterium]